jgi:hypothetical protein
LPKPIKSVLGSRWITDNVVNICLVIFYLWCREESFLIYYVNIWQAVVEDSKRLLFAPNTLDYGHLTAPWATSGLDPAVNNWEQVGAVMWPKERLIVVRSDLVGWLILKKGRSTKTIIRGLMAEYEIRQSTFTEDFFWSTTRRKSGGQPTKAC